MDERFIFYFLKALLIGIVVLYALQIFEYFLALFLSKRRFYCQKLQTMDIEKASLSAGVSIIKPLMGTDPCLSENLESHFTLNFPNLELLCCFHSDTDTAIEVVKRLMEKYPKVDCKLLISDQYTATNPMIRNMMPAYDSAKYDLLWVSTSRIRANWEIFMDLLIRVQPDDVGLVHQMPYITDTRLERNSFQRLVHCVDKIYFGCNLSKHFLTADFLGVGLFCGMSYMTKKSALQQIGGFEHLGNYLAEDFFLQRRMQEKGFKTVLSQYPAEQHMLTGSLVSYKDRLVRWTRLRIVMVPIIALLLEPLTNAFSQAVMCSLALYHLFSIHPAIFVPLHLLFWFFCDMRLGAIIERKRQEESLLFFTGAWIIRELMVYYVLFEALLSPTTVRWGRGTYQIACGGFTTRLDGPAACHLDA